MNIFAVFPDGFAILIVKIIKPHEVDVMIHDGFELQKGGVYWEWGRRTWLKFFRRALD